MSSLASITILAIDRDENLALHDWARGLDWVRWILSDIRSHLPPLSTATESPLQEADVLRAWDHFASHLFLPLIGPSLKEAWHAAHSGRTRKLAQVAQDLDKSLPIALRERSSQAADLLLRGTRHAVYQEVLGKHRAAIAEGRCPAHLIPVWAATGVLFQLGFANVCAEYLRLEWSMLSRLCLDLAEPSGTTSIVELTQQLVHTSPHTLKIEPEAPNPDSDLRKQG